MSEEKQQEVPVVLGSNAVADPNAVVIKAQHALIAQPAVLTTGRAAAPTTQKTPLPDFTAKPPLQHRGIKEQHEQSQHNPPQDKDAKSLRSTQSGAEAQQMLRLPPRPAPTASDTFSLGAHAVMPHVPQVASSS